MSDNRAANHALYRQLAELDPWFAASYVAPVIEDERVPVGVIVQAPLSRHVDISEREESELIARMCRNAGITRERYNELDRRDVPEMMQRVPVPVRESERKTPATGWIEGDRCSAQMCNEPSFDEPTRLCYYHRNLLRGNNSALALADCIDA